MSDRVTINTEDEKKEVIMFKSPKLNIITKPSEFRVSGVEPVGDSSSVRTRGPLSHARERKRPGRHSRGPRPPPGPPANRLLAPRF